MENTYIRFKEINPSKSIEDLERDLTKTLDLPILQEGVTRMALTNDENTWIFGVPREKHDSFLQEI